MNRRRGILMASAGLGVLVLGAASYETWRVLARHYPPTPYDDLLALVHAHESPFATF